MGPKSRLKLRADRAFIVVGPKLCNSLTVFLQLVPLKYEFKSKLKAYLKAYNRPYSKRIFYHHIFPS